MPSSFFDDFADIILDVHGIDDPDVEVYLVEPDGTQTLLAPVRFNEAFRGVEIGEAAMIETRKPLAWILEKQLPDTLLDGDPMGCTLLVGEDSYRILGSEPDGYGERLIKLYPKSRTGALGHIARSIRQA